MSVGTWNPSERITELSTPVLDELLAAATRSIDEDFGLSQTAVERLAGSANTNRADWRAALQNLDGDQIIALMRFYTLAEGRFPAWQAGSNSPVIPLARALRARGAWPPELTAWIKRHTDNKFLPYGSLLDRL